MNNKIGTIILAGGKNTRIGLDKAFIRFSGKPLIEILINKLSCLFDELMIVTNKPHLYEKYGIKTQPDIIKDCGPLGGIYTGLRFSRNEYNFVVACDMPFLNRDLIKFMSKEIVGYDVVVPEHNGQLEPLCAIYSRTCIKPIEKQLSRGNLKITSFLRYVRTKKITEEEILKFADKKKCFANINTLRDYQSIKTITNL